MLDNADDAKKHKSKGLKPGKALKQVKGLVGGGAKAKEKKEKKEQKRQQQKEMMSKYVSDEPDNAQSINKEDSEEWKKYQELVGKSEHDVQESKDKLTKMEAGFQGEIEKLWGLPISSASNSPWSEGEGVSPLDAPIDDKNPPKVGWVGFDDNFSNKEEISKTTVTSSSKTDDLLGIGASGMQTADLLGGFDDNELGEDSNVNNVDGFGSQAAADSSNLGALGSEGDYVKDSDNTENAGMSIIDDFLGITSSSSTAEKQPQSKDALEMLMSKGENEDKSSGLNDIDEFLGIQATDNSNNTKNEGNTTTVTQISVDDIDDAFGFSSGDTAKQSNIQDNLKLNGDLFDLGVEEGDKNEDPFMVNLDKITKETEAATTGELEDNKDGNTLKDLKSPMSDDFDPRADFSEEKIQAKPVMDTPPVVCLFYTPIL